MKQFRTSIIILVLIPALAGCAARQSARAVPMNPTVDQMLKEISANPSNNKVTASIEDGIRDIRRGKYEDANKRFAEGLRIDPMNGNLHFLNGLAYHLSSLSGDQAVLEFAEAGYALSLRFDPDNYWAAFFLGHVYFNQKRYWDAQNQFSYALLYEPDQDEFLRALAVASYYVKELEVGSWAAEKAVKVDPEHPSGWRIVSLIRAAQGDFAGSEEGFRRYQELVGKQDASGKHEAALQWESRHILERIDGWKSLYRSNPTIVQAQAPSVFGAAGAQAEGKPLDLGNQGDSYDGTDEDLSAHFADQSSTAAASYRKSGANLPKMALVDVVILSSEESRNLAKGVNLLAGLKATLTGTLFAYKYVSGIAAGGGSANEESRTMAPTFALEGLQYNLNIWNDGINKAEVLARPSLLAVENQTSQFYSGAVLHVQLNSNNSDGSLVDVPVGINLSVTPTFLDDNTVNIKVHADRSFIETRDVKLGFSAFSQTSKTTVDATAVLRFGETLILSGLSENETTKSKSGVPFLQRIPGVQYLFSQKTEEETKKSVLILLSPHKARYANEHMTPSDIKEMKKALRRGKKGVEHVKALRKKEGIAGKDNLDVVFEKLDKSKFYRGFQTGDLRLDEWHNSDTMIGALKRVLGFLWY